jgi:hypothetical protein
MSRTMTAESDEPTPPSATIPELLAGQKAIVTGGSSGIARIGRGRNTRGVLKAAQEPTQQRSIVF